MAVWQSPACWSLPSGCHCCAHLDSSSQACSSGPTYARTKSLQEVSFPSSFASWDLLAGKREKVSVRPYCARYFKGQLPSEDLLKHTKAKHSTICSSQSKWMLPQGFLLWVFTVQLLPAKRWYSEIERWLWWLWVLLILFFSSFYGSV